MSDIYLSEEVRYAKEEMRRLEETRALFKYLQYDKVTLMEKCLRRGYQDALFKHGLLGSNEIPYIGRCPKDE